MVKRSGWAVHMKRSRVLLVTNYPADAQQSMLRWGKFLAEGLPATDWEVDMIAPAVRWRKTARRGGLAKWLGYLDKYIEFPRILERRIAGLPENARRLVHVVDHSNAVYIPRGPRRETWVVTCHDLLAVRGALGEDTGCHSSWFGGKLQRAIVRGLQRADAVAIDSTSTRDDFERVVRPPGAQLRRVIPLALGYPFRRIAPGVAKARLADAGGVPWDEPFVLHVGSNEPRKNRAGVVRIFARIAEQWPGNLVFCGDALPSGIMRAAARKGVGGRVFAATSLNNLQLEAAYNVAHALLFPSIAEGFGWPPIEAQACGCPVVCSDRTSIPEVVGGAGLLHALADEEGMAASLLRLGNGAVRADLVARGFSNAARFTPEKTLADYGRFYLDALANNGVKRGE